MNEIENTLIEIGAIDPESIVEYFPRVRDRDDVKVMKCMNTGVIYLSQSNDISISHYTEMADLEYWGKGIREDLLKLTFEDDHRRAIQFEKEIKGKYWVDIGTGLGGILDIAGKWAGIVGAVEPQTYARESLTKLGYVVHSNIDNLEDESVDLITLFHVLEHFINPVSELNKIYLKLKKGGKLIVEIPHAQDFLISTLELESFKNFTFWSEHLILHTRESINKLLSHVGFKNNIVMGHQRYGFANHLHWLARNKPGGHKIWNQYSTPELESAYNNMLLKNDNTDTLVIISTKE